MKEGDSLFRSLPLTDSIPGEIHLHSMPGRYEPFPQAREEMAAQGISTVVSLTSEDEIREKASDYGQAIDAGTFSIERISFPIGDYGTPSDRSGYLSLVRDLVDRLAQGEKILIHCGAGIGRTGTLAIAVLMALGMTYEQAARQVLEAGSRPETEAQQDFLRWVETQLGKSTIQR